MYDATLDNKLQGGENTPWHLSVKTVHRQKHRWTVTVSAGQLSLTSVIASTNEVTILHTVNKTAVWHWLSTVCASTYHRIFNTGNQHKWFDYM